MLRLMVTINRYGYLPDGIGGRKRVVVEAKRVQLRVSYTSGQAKLDGSLVHAANEVKAVGYYHDLKSVNPLDEVVIEGKTYTVNSLAKLGRNEIILICNGNH